MSQCMYIYIKLLYKNVKISRAHHLLSKYTHQLYKSDKSDNNWYSASLLTICVYTVHPVLEETVGRRREGEGGERGRGREKAH